MTKETVGQIFIGAIGAIVAVVLIALWNWAVDGGIVSSLGGAPKDHNHGGNESMFPQHAVIAFDAKCPKGWTDVGLTDADRFAGRVIIAVGTPSKTYEGSIPGRTYSDRGGTATHTLKPGEMPEHSHEILHYKMGHSVDGSGDKHRIDSNDGPTWGGIDERLITDKKGESKPHNNMPPFIALYFCKKT